MRRFVAPVLTFAVLFGAIAWIWWHKYQRPVPPERPAPAQALDEARPAAPAPAPQAIPAPQVLPQPETRPEQPPALPAAPAPAAEPALPAPPARPPQIYKDVAARAVEYGPLLADKQRALWPDAPQPWTLAGLIEQETGPCPHGRQCWNARAELKTYREYGFGLGQITIAYNADGSERFNEFAELKRKYSSLAAWRYADRYDPGYQLTAIVEMVHALWRRAPPAQTQDDTWAFTDASYNGGLGALLQDRRYCANSAGCNPLVWFGHVETHSLKSKAPQKAYGGQSFYKINRDHVRHVLTVFRAKYRPFWERAS
jgi:hypothetical protein